MPLSGGVFEFRRIPGLPLPELAQELGCSQFDLEQALFAVQSLDPPGHWGQGISPSACCCSWRRERTSLP